MWQQWPSPTPTTGFAQPPFMPPNVVGPLQNCWTPSPPTATTTKPVSLSCELFPYNPQNHKYRWRQYEEEAQSYEPYSHSKKPRLDNFIDYCDVCDRGFKTEEKRKQHYSEHTTCSEPDCSFEAHYKIVEIHKRNLHGPNGFRIKLDTPEDIRKWREARKKNFPSEKKIKEKKLEETEKRKSGAVLEEQSFGKFRRGKNNRRGRGGKFNDRRNRNFHEGHDSTAIENKDIVELSKESNTAPETNSTAKSIDNSDVTSLTSLSQLISNYGSDDNDENKNNDKVVSEDKEKSVINEKIDKENDAVRKNDKHVKNRSFNNDRKHTFQSSSKPSLLRMLLEPEIRRERNDILQCVRFVVKENFFDSTPS